MQHLALKLYHIEPLQREWKYLLKRKYIFRLSSSSNGRETEVKCLILAMWTHWQGLASAWTMRRPHLYYRTDLWLCGNSSSDVINTRRWCHRTSYTSAALNAWQTSSLFYAHINLNVIYLFDETKSKKCTLCPLPSSAHGSITAIKCKKLKERCQLRTLTSLLFNGRLARNNIYVLTAFWKTFCRKKIKWHTGSDADSVDVSLPRIYFLKWKTGSISVSNEQECHQKHEINRKRGGWDATPLLIGKFSSANIKEKMKKKCIKK